jgi:hypothetical protein
VLSGAKSDADRHPGSRRDPAKNTVSVPLLRMVP